jgi:putative redox protein
MQSGWPRSPHRRRRVVSNTAELRLETVEGTGLRFRVRAGSGTETVTDSGPGMTAPSPVEMLLVALGGCGGMDVISILRKKRQQVTGYEVRVTGERRTEHPRAYTKIELLHRLHGRDLSPGAIEEAIRLSETKYCSIHASLRHEIEIVSRYEIIPA